MAVIRKTSQVSLSTIAQSAALGTAVYVNGCERGYVVMPAAWTAADLGFKVSDKEDGTYSILRKSDGTTVVKVAAPTADYAFQLPSELFSGAVWIKPWSKNTASEVDAAQAAARELKFVVI